MASRHAKVIIIGSGPAGYTAGIYAARAMLKPLLIEGIHAGGQMTTTTDVENYPGFADVIQGPWLMEQMRLQAEHVGTEIIRDHIVEVDVKRQPFWLKGDSHTEYTADALIIATGAQARWLGLPGVSFGASPADPWLSEISHPSTTPSGRSVPPQAGSSTAARTATTASRFTGGPRPSTRSPRPSSPRRSATR